MFYSLLNINKDIIYVDRSETGIVMMIGDTISVFADVEALIWEMLEQGRTQKQIVDSLCNEYSDENCEEISKDVSSFIASLLEANLISL